MWTEKYKPASLEEMVGNRQALAELERWLAGWKRGHKGMLLWGPAGIGKTTAAYLAAERFGLEVVEMNASDLRNKKQVEAVLGAAAIQPSLSGRSRLLLVDEVDGMSGKGRGGDYGGIGAVVDIIKKSSYPVVLTANKVILSAQTGGDRNWEGVFSRRFRGRKVTRFEFFSFLKEVMETEGLKPNERMLWAVTYANFGKGDVSAALAALPIRPGANWWEWNSKLAPLRSHCRIVEFSRPAGAEVAGMLEKIAEKEGIAVEKRVLGEIAARTGGDVRAAVTALEAVGRGRKAVGEDDIAMIEGRRRELKIEEAVRMVLATTDPAVSQSALRMTDVRPDEFAKYLDENLGGRYAGDELAAAYERVSRADVLSGRMGRSGSYGLLPFQIELLTAGVSLSKKERRQVEGRIVWPMSRYDPGAAKAGRLVKSISAKVRRAFPLAKPRGLLLLLKNDGGLRDACGLDDDERELLKKWKS